MVEYKISSNISAEFNRISKGISDLRPVFIQMAREFYKANKAIFTLKSAGQYADFNGKKIGETWSRNGILNFRTRNENYTPYQWHKEKKTGMRGGYPLLKFTGRLEKSITSDSSSDSINSITPDSLTIGTSVPYGVHHQYGAPKANVPMRQFLFIDPSTTAWASSSVFSRRNVAWQKALDSYVERLVNG